MDSFLESTNKIVERIYRDVGSLDPFVIADYYGFEYRFVDSTDDFEGQTHNVLGEPLILINSDLVDCNWKYAVMAHELYHVLEHPELANYYNLGIRQKNEFEYQAHGFTAVILFNLYIEQTGRNPMYYSEIKSYFDLEDDYEEFFF